MDVSERICHNGTHLKWATHPKISFPSRLSPGAPLESVKVKQKPFIYSKKNCFGRPCRITWRFTVEQGIKGASVQEFVFYYRVYPVGSELCLGKSCAKKRWAAG